MKEEKLIITNDLITLGQLLKELSLISSGGMAKHYLNEHLVLVNDEVENRRGRKLYPQDRVNFNSKRRLKLMYLSKLSLKNFRNYSQLDIQLNPGLTILTGENAQGKTNLLEAIFLLSLAKSHRTNHDIDMIQWGSDYAIIQGNVKKNSYEIPLEIQLSKKGKIAKFNYQDQAKLSQFIGKLNVVLFAPEDMQLIKGSPSLRRQFIDAELGQAQPLYLQSLLQYHRLLKQRNTYLKQLREKQAKDLIYLDIISDQLIEHAEIIINYRLDFIEHIGKIANKIHHNLSLNRDELTLFYQASSSKLDYQSKETIKKQFSDIFFENRQRDIDFGITHYGPHRDDLLFFINDTVAQNFASQGQQRTIILSLKLAELEWMYRLNQDYPVLLLDDVLSELDDQRQLVLMQTIENKVQTILTTASIDQIHLENLSNSQLFKIENGQIINEGD